MKIDSWKPSTYGHQVVTDDSMHSICELKPTGNMWEQRRRAYLLAAAPDLLEACQELCAAMRDYAMDVDEDPPHKHREMMNRARVAIAKAHAPAEISYICEECGRETPIRMNGSCVECADRNRNE